MTLDRWRDLLPGYFDEHEHLKRRTQHFFPWLDWLPSKGIILDIGIGYGRYAKHLLSLGYSLVGADITTSLFDELVELGVTPFELPGDGTITLPGPVDAVISTSVMQHLDTEQTLKYLNESMRVLRHGGVMMHTYSKSKGNHRVRFSFTDTIEPFTPFAIVEPLLPEWITLYDCVDVFLLGGHKDAEDT